MNVKKNLKQIALFGTILLSTLPAKAGEGYFSAPEWRIPVIFECPRKGYWTMKDWNKDDINNSSYVHFFGSMDLQFTAEEYFKSRNSKHPELYGFILTNSLGLLKEIEDGNREGFSCKDLTYNITGSLLELALNKYVLSPFLLHKKKSKRH